MACMNVALLRSLRRSSTISLIVCRQLGKVELVKPRLQAVDIDRFAAAMDVSIEGSSKEKRIGGTRSESRPRASWPVCHLLICDKRCGHASVSRKAAAIEGSDSGSHPARR